MTSRRAADHAADGSPSTVLRVRYADTDAQGVVYHGAFFTFFEVARFELLARLLGSEAAASRFWRRLAIAAARCEYLAPAQHPELLAITARVRRVGTSSFEVTYTVTNSQAVVLARGSTTQVALTATGRPLPLASRLRRQLTAVDHTSRSVRRRPYSNAVKSAGTQVRK